MTKLQKMYQMGRLARIAIGKGVFIVILVRGLNVFVWDLDDFYLGLDLDIELDGNFLEKDL